MKPLFGKQSRFTTIDKANVLMIYDALNLFFTMALSKSIGSMVTSTHIPSGQVYGSFRRIKANIRQFTKPGQRVALVFAWDNKPVEAQEILPQYKMNRDATQLLEEEDKILRLDAFRKTLEQMPSTFIEAPYEEADHVIASTVFQNNKPAMIMSSDKDLWTLLQNPRVKIVSMRKSTVITEAELKEKFAINSRKDAYKVSLYKAVMGDSSDNIPKVPRIPSKDLHAALNSISYTAKDDCVALLINSASKLPKQKAHTLLVEHESLIRRNLQLTTLKNDLKLQATWNTGSKEKLESIFYKFECRSILSEGAHNFLFQ